MKIAVCIPPPPSPQVIANKEKIWKLFIINNVFENFFIAANKELLLTTGFLRFFINNQPLLTMRFKNSAISLIYYYFL